MIKTERVAIPVLKDFYDMAVAKKERIEEELRVEYENILKTRVANLDAIINESSELVEVEVPDEVENADTTENNEFVGE